MHTAYATGSMTAPQPHRISRSRSHRSFGWVALLALAVSALLVGVAEADTPRPYGYYVVNEAANNRNAAKAYATGMTSSSAYLQHVAGHAIFVPIGKILPHITTWGDFNWKWGYVDTLVDTALAHGKHFSIELETGYQTNTGNGYLQALPPEFASTCGADCAPLFDVWAAGGGGTCTSSYVLLPWKPNVQQFWTLAADSLAAHLRNIGAYGALTLVHLPGLSVYDEEIRLPNGIPVAQPADSTYLCPDGRPGYPTSNSYSNAAQWASLGYSDSSALAGFKIIANAFAQAFPDRMLGLSLFPGRAFPNPGADSVGYMPYEIVQEVTSLAPGRVQLQADDLDIANTWSEVVSNSATFQTAIGWQSNKKIGLGAGCGTGTCGPDGFDSPYYQLLQTGAQSHGHYIEVWSADVVAYPASFAEADSAGFTSLAGVPLAPPNGVALRLSASPNPARGRVWLRTTGLGGAVGTIEIEDVSGRLVQRIAWAPGARELAWDGRSRAGTPAPAGVYFATLRTVGRSTGRAGFVLLR